ncbi:diol dehydratase small subunit [Actinoplanes subtropicus]|uniref:diol dehydratase small subunit n=1 Tax=Actinoplanes subtropicus TaxID=543632 RepID=UPI0004C2DAC7|nr:diol dehydratase small subunit [Actinoplanes subtropicus]
MSNAYSGKPAAELTIDALVRDELAADDVRIHPDTLEAQARVAERHGNPQLAENFRRAAELTRFGEAEILALYEALRPRRSTAGELAALAADLAARDAPRCAALVREAAAAYARRGLLR